MQHPTLMTRAGAFPSDIWHVAFRQWLQSHPFPRQAPIQGLQWYQSLEAWLGSHPFPTPTPPPPSPPPVPPTPQWPSFTGTSQFVGTSLSGKANVWVDPSLGSQGLQNASDLVNDADRVIKANDSFFGSPGGNVNVIVFALGGRTDGTGGADHMGCDYSTGGNIEVCASFGNSARVSALFEAELSECSMGGNLCGVSTGEALSRWCAMLTSNNALSDFAVAPWWAQDGMANWVDSTDPTDQDADSTGCGLAFISWLVKLGNPISKIAPELVSLGANGTLSNLYVYLTGDAPQNAWSKFIAAVNALPGGVTSDNPFA